jgi:hypothetical protein
MGEQGSLYRESRTLLPRSEKKNLVSLQDRPARQRNVVFAPGISLPRHFPCRRRAPSLMTLYEPFTTTAFVTGLVCLPARSLGGAAYYPVTVHRNTLLTLLLYESTVVMVL